MSTLATPAAGWNSVSSVLLRKRWLPGLLAAWLAGSLHICLLWNWPELYGGDSVIHIRNSDHIFLGHQLPALQVLLRLAGTLVSGPASWKLLMAALHVFAAVSFYLLATVLLREPYALATALLFVTDPFLNEISMVPFSEILMLGALCLTLWLYARQRFVASSLILALACFTRYEAWILCPLLTLAYCHRSETNIRNLARGAMLFGWAPVLWLLVHSGVSNPGSAVIEMPRSALRVVRWIYLGWITAKTTPIFVLGLAIPGAWVASKSHTFRNVRSLILAFYVVFLVSILFSAHGDSHTGRSSPELFVSSREATVLIAGVLLLAGLGVQALCGMPRVRRFVPAILALALSFGIAQSALLIRSQTSAADVALSFRLARYLDSHVRPGETVVILAKPFSGAELSGYRGAGDHLAKGERSTIVDLSPIDFQRTAVQCRIPSGSLRSSLESSNPGWIAVWSNAPRSPSLNVWLANLERADTLVQPDLSVAIYRRHSRS